MMRRKWAPMMFIVACSSQSVIDESPIDITRSDTCALDGMTIVDHHGPKAQILRRDGSRLMFCDAKEAIGEMLSPGRRKLVHKIWFQILDERSWTSHRDKWAEGVVIYFVIGSKKMGSMGPTVAPFLERGNAKNFVSRNGGDIFQLGEITLWVYQKIMRQGMNNL